MENCGNFVDMFANEYSALRRGQGKVTMGAGRVAPQPAESTPYPSRGHLLRRFFVSATSNKRPRDVELIGGKIHSLRLLSADDQPSQRLAFIRLIDVICEERNGIMVENHDAKSLLTNEH